MATNSDKKSNEVSPKGPITGPKIENPKEDQKEIKKFIEKNGEIINKKSVKKLDKSSKKLDKSRDLYYFYSVGCGFCKKAEPIVDELNKEGYNILKLDLAEKDNQGLNQELKQKYNVQCGTPWFVDPESGNQVCGFREKDIIQKWADGEEIPAPPRPKGPVPKLPFHEAPEEEVNKWKEEYAKWTEENSHLPNLQTAEQLLSRPRPKTEPPPPPVQNATDEQLEEWAKKYDKWKDENTHLPNLQPSEVIVQRFKQGAQGAQAGNTASSGLLPEDKARISRLEQKLDKLIKHLGVK